MSNKTLAEEFADDMVDGMDMESMAQFVYENLLKEYESLPKNDLINLVREHAPYLIDEEV